MALEVGGAQKIFDRNQGIYDAIQASPDFASFVGDNRGNLFDWSVSNNFMPSNLETAAQSIGNPGLNNFLGGGVLTSTRQTADRTLDAAQDAFSQMSDAELAQIVGGSTLANPGNLNLNGREYALNFSPTGQLIPPSLSDDAGGVYGAYPGGTGYDIGELSLADIYNTLKGTDSATFAESQDATFDKNFAREAKPGLAELAVGLGAAGTLGGAFKASGLGGKLNFNNPLSGIFKTANANAVPGFSTGVTTPLGGAAITGTGQAAPLLGLAGGAPLGASPLAVAGGAAALPGVQPLPTGGKIPGTNINVGTPDGGSAFNIDANDVIRAAQNITGLTSEQPTQSAGGAAIPGAPYRGPTLYDGNPYPETISRIPAYFQYMRS